MIALARPDPDDDKIRAYMEALLPIIPSFAVLKETRGENDRIDIAFLDQPKPPEEEPLANAKYAEVDVIRHMVIQMMAAFSDSGRGQTEANTDKAIGRLKTAYRKAGVDEKHLRPFVQRTGQQVERVIAPQGLHDLIATIPPMEPTAAETATREATAKILEEITGLNVEILSRDDTFRQYYQFTVKPRDPQKTARDQPVSGMPLIVHQLHEYIASLIRHSGAGESACLEMSPKDDWYTSVKLHFGGGGGFSLPPEEGLEVVERMKRGLQAFAKRAYPRDGLAGYQREQLAAVDFIDGNVKRVKGS